MKTILIATDFSAASRNASLYGWQLAKALGTKVILFSAYEVSHPIAAMNVQISHFDVRMQVQKKLTDEAEVIASHDASRIELVCDEGSSQDMILSIAVEKGADIIIVGMKDGGKNLKKIFGSTATSIIKNATIPVIVVPEGASYSTPKNIVYASGIFLDTTIQVIDQIQWLTAFFSSELHVVRVVKDDYEAVREQVNTPNRFRPGLTAMKTTFQFPENANISKGLNDFIKTQYPDLLVMSPHNHEWLERIFVKSETKDMVFHSHIPLLVLPQTPIEPGEIRSIVNNRN